LRKAFQEKKPKQKPKNIGSTVRELEKWKEGLTVSANYSIYKVRQKDIFIGDPFTCLTDELVMWCTGKKRLNIASIKFSKP